MAQDRTNMVSLLDIGSIMGGNTERIVELGDGFTELSEDWGPSIDSKQYINMKAQSSTVSGYQFSMNPSREYISDEVQKTFDRMLKVFPTGKNCETSYYRFFKTDAVEGTEGRYEAIRVPVVVAPSGAGGSGGETLTTSVQINGNGSVETGYITLSDDGESYTWS